jgi:CheY-like chemotaxis protein
MGGSELNMKSRSYLLYAEDDPDDVLFLRDVLRLSDREHSLFTVANGFELIQFLQGIQQGETYPSLIILDIRMPRLDGIEVLQLLKTDDLYRMIPVIVFSNHANESQKEACYRLDTEILSKPLYYTGWDNVIQKMRSYFDE